MYMQINAGETSILVNLQNVMHMRALQAVDSNNELIADDYRIEIHGAGGAILTINLSSQEEMTTALGIIAEHVQHYNTVLSRGLVAHISEAPESPAQ